jgi:hypothetical protein
MQAVVVHNMKFIAPHDHVLSTSHNYCLETYRVDSTLNKVNWNNAAASGKSTFQEADDSRPSTNACAIATIGDPVGSPGNGPEDPAMSTCE